MPREKLPPDILAELKDAIRDLLAKDAYLTAYNIYEVVHSDPIFAKKVTLGMVQNHLGNIRRELLMAEKTAVKPPEEPEKPLSEKPLSEKPLSEEEILFNQLKKLPRLPGSKGLRAG